MYEKLTSLYICTLLCMLIPPCKAQNLVPNPGFELSTPPCSLMFDKATFKASTQYWQWPILATADIYSTLSSPGCDLHMPRVKTTGINESGSELPRTGNFLAGFIPFGKIWPGPSSSLPPVYREYLEVPLIHPLEVGKTYCASMYVIMSDKKEYACNNLGMYFSDTLIDLNYFTELIFSPQVNETSLITDTTNWVKISGCFVATSPAQYLLIGNFKPDTATAFKFLYYTDGVSLGYWNCYYYLDDISVEEYSNTPLTRSNDTTVCKNASIDMVATGPDLIWWSVAGSTDTIAVGNTLSTNVSSDTKYVVHGNNCNCNQLLDTIALSIFPEENFTIGNDTTICKNGAVKVNIDHTTFTNAAWNTVVPDSYHTLFTEKGLYYVSVTDYNNCLYSDSLSIFKVISPPEIDIVDAIFICEPYAVRLPNSSGYHYIWSDEDTNSVKTINKAGTYSVNAFNSCGEDGDTLVVYDKNNIVISNLVTLNGDLKNDYLIIEGLLPNTEGYLLIYNRWGEKIYEDSHYQNSWPSTDLSDGIYYYYFSYDNCIQIKSWVEVLR